MSIVLSYSYIVLYCRNANKESSCEMPLLGNKRSADGQTTAAKEPSANKETSCEMPLLGNKTSADGQTTVAKEPSAPALEESTLALAITVCKMVRGFDGGINL